MSSIQKLASKAEHQSDEMFDLAKSLTNDDLAPSSEMLARICFAIGIIGKAIARADQAYAEGARQRSEAAKAAARDGAPADQPAAVVLDLPFEARGFRVGETLSVELLGADERAAAAALLRTAQQFGRSVRLSLVKAVDE